MKKDLFALYLEFLGKLRSQVVSDFETSVREAIPDDENEILPNFAGVMQELNDRAIERFTSLANGAIIEQAVGEWSTDHELEELKGTLEKAIREARENQLRRLVDRLEKDIRIKIVEPLEDVLEAPDENVWDSIRNIEEEGKKKTVGLLEKELQGFGCTNDEINKKVSSLEKKIRTNMTEIIKKHVSNLYDSMIKIFSKKFQYDNGLPRKWSKDLDVEALYIESKQEALSAIDLFAINRIDDNNNSLSVDDDDVPVDLILLSKRERSQLEERFLRTSDAMFTTARSEQERNSVATQIPAFMVILLLAFAFDEIIWILSNPFLFMLTVMVAGIFGFLWYFDLLYIVKPIFNTALRTSVSNVHHILTSSNEKEKEKKD